MLFTQIIILHAGRTLQALGIHHYTQRSRKETHSIWEINRTIILIDKVSKINTLIITIPGSTWKLYRMFRRYNNSREHKE
jgi:1,2-phenylacetyl-CoA epoxidase PaaB subunit